MLPRADARHGCGQDSIPWYFQLVLRGGGDCCAESKEKGKQDKRDAALLIGSLKAEEAKQLAKAEGLTLGESSKSGTGFTNVHVQDDGKGTLRPFRISPRMYNTMPSSVSREYVSAEHAALEIARHVRNLGRQAVAGRVATSADSNAVVIDLT